MVKGIPPPRVALVTGGSSGIGLACVRQFVSAGWRVSLTALPAPDLAQRMGPEVLTTPGDITSDTVRRQIVERTLERYGRIDALVNCAGVGLYASPSEVPMDLARQLFEVNVLSTLAMSQAVIPIMRRQGSGAIVNLGSVAGFASLPWASAYCASKAAVHSLNDALRRELRKDRIHVMKACPGIVDTPFRLNVLGGSAPARVASIRTVVSPEAVAAAILWGIEKRRPTVYVPAVGRLFRLVEFFCPRLIDWYTERLSTPPAVAVFQSETPTGCSDG